MIGNFLKQVQGWVKLKGSTDGTMIGNVSDALKSSIVSSPQNPVYTSLDPRAIDAIGRQRVSEPRTIFELTAGEGLDTVRYIDTQVTGTATIDSDSASISAKLSVSASGDKAVTQTRRRIQYAQGSSQFILMQVRFATPTANVRQRRGYFCSDNGLFFEIDGTTKYVVRRSNLSGSPVDTRVAQSSWNVDPLDGTGVSGKTWDVTDQTSLAIDFVWDLGVIRYYIGIDGQYYLVHVDTTSGLEAPFMFSGMAPVRSEMEATGTISGTYSSYTTSAVVASEGNEVTLGRVRTVDTGTTAVSVDTTEKVIAGIKLQDAKITGSIKALGFNIQPESGSSNVYYKVIYNPTLTGATWSNLTGLAQGLTNNPTYSGGSVLSSGYLDLGSTGGGGGGGGSKVGSGTFDEVNSDVFLGSDISGNPDALILVVRTISGSGSILFSGNYREFF